MRVSFLLELLFLTCLCSLVLSAKRTSTFREPNNKIMSVVTAKHQTVQHFVHETDKNKRIARRRMIDTNVNPLEENCLADNFRDELSKLRLRVKCEPRDTVVDIISPNGAMLIPNAVVVKRCGGMCNGFKKCISLEKRDVKFYIRKVEEKQMYCSSILVSEDTKCRCDCLQKASDCNSSQVYNKENCACICKNQDDFNRCSENQNENIHWDDGTCTCVCQQNKSCTTGTVWNDSECRCIIVNL